MSPGEKFLKYGLWVVLLVLVLCACGFFKGGMGLCECALSFIPFGCC